MPREIVGAGVSTDPEFMDKVVERAIDICITVTEGALDQLEGARGAAYGLVPLKGAEILFDYVDKRDRGVLAQLREIAPHHADALDRDATREAAKFADRAE